MPDYTPAYAPIAGSTLSPAGVNSNFYTVTSGDGIYEIANGHIESVNFDPAYEVESVHVRPGQAGEALSVGQVLSNDYFSDLFVGPPGGNPDYVAIVGATITFRQRYASTLALLGATGFCSMWRQFAQNKGSFGARENPPDIHVQAFIQSGTSALTLIDHTKRELPQTVHWNSASVNPDAQIVTSEQALTRNFNLIHPRVAGGSSPFTALSSGWHTYGLAILIRQNPSGQDTSDPLEDYRLQLNGAGSPDARPVTYYSAIHRVRMFVRSATAVRLL